MVQSVRNLAQILLILKENRFNNKRSQLLSRCLSSQSANGCPKYTNVTNTIQKRGEGRGVGVGVGWERSSLKLSILFQFKVSETYYGSCFKNSFINPMP